jgi:hypothetical protein
MQQLEHNNGKAVFSTSPVPRGYKRDEVRASSVSRVEAGSNNYTAALRVVGGDEKKVSNLRQSNTVTSSTELGTENDYAGEDQQQL